MSVQNQNAVTGESVVLERPQTGGVYASLFEKINLSPVSELSALDIWQDAQAMSDASADERLTAGMQVFLECLSKSGAKVEKLDKTLIDHHIATLDYQISRQLDAVMHNPEFQRVEGLWRGLKHLVDNTDYRQNVKTEILDVSKEDLRQDFEDSPEIIQSGLYAHTYIAEYDTPGGEPIGAVISAYEFDASPQDVALMRNISKVSASAHMPFIGSAGPKFFLKENMEQVAAIKDIGNYFDRAEYIKWKSFRETDDSRYIGLVMPRVLGRLPYGPDTVPVRSFNYVEEVKGPDHEKYLWTSASFAFAANMVRSFINNGWCVQIRGPQAGGAVQDLPIHLYDLGTGSQVKIPSEVMIPETREFEFSKALPLMLRFCWDSVIDKKSYETLILFKKGTWEQMTTLYTDSYRPDETYYRDTMVIGLAPGGKVSVWLDNLGDPVVPQSDAKITTVSGDKMQMCKGVTKSDFSYGYDQDIKEFIKGKSYPYGNW